MAVSYFLAKTKRPFYILFLIFVLAGFLLTGRNIQPTSTDLAGGTQPVSGSFLVTQTGETSGGFQKLRLEGIPEEDAFQGDSLCIYAIRMEGKPLTVGDEIQLRGEALSFSKPTIPGSYNEELYLCTQGYDCKMFLSDFKKVGEKNNLSVFLHKGKERVDQILNQVLPSEESGVVKALITGDRDDILEGTEELYRMAGITHILCISGLHISLLAMMAAWLMESVFHMGRRSAAAVTIVFSVCFLIFTGFSPSAVRAVIMVTVALVGRILQRRHDWLNNIAIAALVLLWIQPLYLWNAGFQLSFLSVIGIWAGSRFYGKRNDLLGKVWDMILVSFFAFLFTFPITAYHFYHITPYSILANLVVLPFSGLLLGSGFLTVLLGFFSTPLSSFAAGSAYMILQIYEAICRLAEKLPFCYPLTGSPAPETILLYYGVLFVFLFCGRKERIQTILLSSFGTVLLLQLWGNSLFQKENTVTFLDVGQGDCAVIQTYNDECFLVDGGGIATKELGDNIGTEKILPYLEYLGVDHISGIFLSHLDADHILGALEVMDALPVDGVYLPDYAITAEQWEKEMQEILEKNQIPLYTVKEGDKGELEEAGNFLCLYPFANTQLPKGGSNAGSMVLKYSYADVDILFTGDLEEGQERLLLAEPEGLSCDVLKVSHHGSAGASSSEFLAATNAQLAVISCGQDNPYHHPAQETLARFAQAGISVCRTDEQGSILLHISPSGGLSWTIWGERKPVYERIKETMETGRIS
ncbi:DNA internalization-related competence protein ComEC/Rec2 [Anaerotignum lactatifermentans]|nr:DNA internalization-related competence protein ComEC/Rec2 [Anaerotignum lactatifermentans]